MRKLDKIIVIDLEATCWEGDPPAGESSEIIEIGLCVLDVATGQREPARALLVRPQHSTLSPYCQELTTITPEMVEDALDLADACAVLREEYHSEARTWASYGDYDRLMLTAQCEARNIPYPFGRSHINVKNLFALQMRLEREVGLQKATSLLGHPFDGTIHRGMDDAWNIAAVLNKILLERKS
ncbi:MAG TPA: DNA polymerase III [Anaerolineaceae bacterium]|jgi:inhibitor of KinA sporulation pathway (predicted exonuclease)|nr:DNA polymerase III [Anaerolineaceae bacterium]